MNNPKTRPIKLAVTGASGRMGQMLVQAIHDAPDATLVGALDRVNGPNVGRDPLAFLGKTSGIVIESDLDRGLSHAECIIDFTRPQATTQYLDYCITHQINMVIGTTGFDEAGFAAIRAAAKHIAIVAAPNMSLGVNVTFKLLALAAQHFSQNYDIEIIEAHHRHKVDAPSGTALKMGQVIAETLGHKLKDIGVYAREGITGERKAGTIGFSTIRGGDIVGDHTALFAGVGERIEISHKSSSRIHYAQGSVVAAQFLSGKTSGLYDMQDVLDV